MLDSHCHLADEVFAQDLEAVVDRARAAGVDRVMTILSAGDAKEAAQADHLSQIWPETRFSVGVHPHQAHDFADDPDRAARVVRDQFEATPAARAIGEVGLDYHYDFSPADVQRAVFRAQVRLARAMRKPLVIHTREADTDTIDILREEGGGEVTGVLHCFTGGERLAAAGLELGFSISVAGIVTFPKASELRATIRAVVPLDRLLTETDSPFLAPVPHRGRRNEPSFVMQVVGALAGMYALSPETIAEHTRENFDALFHP